MSQKIKLVFLGLTEVATWLITAASWAVVLLKALGNSRVVSIPFIEKTPQGWILASIGTILVIVLLSIRKKRLKLKVQVEKENLQVAILAWAGSLRVCLRRTLSSWKEDDVDAFEDIDHFFDQIDDFLAMEADLPSNVVQALREVKGHLRIAADFYRKMDDAGAVEFL